MRQAYQAWSGARKDKWSLSTGTELLDIGGRLREWRRKRRISQFDLACDAEISTKHLSFLETGRSRPTRQVLLKLAMCLQVPLRDRNALLESAGFAAMFEERPFGAPELNIVRRKIEILLATHEPNPALVVDRHWTMLTANRTVAHLVAGAEPMLLRPPVNLLRLFLHPAGLAPRIVNLAQWRTHLIERLRQQIEGSDDPVLIDLLEEVRDYPSPRDSIRSDQMADDTIAVRLQLATFDGVLSFFGTTTLFSTALDITVAELAIEAFLPADSETVSILARLAAAEESQTVTCETAPTAFV
jgi:transcriptional regulator with XRE-family HTH domain